MTLVPWLPALWYKMVEIRSFVFPSSDKHIARIRKSNICTLKMFKRSGTLSFSLFVPESHPLRLESTESDSFSPSIPSNAARQPGSAVCIATEARHHLHGGREPSRHCNSWEPQRLGAPKTPFKQIHFTQICGGYHKIVGTAGENLGGTLGQSHLCIEFITIWGILW